MERLKNKKGISLTGLIITIIVLMIIALVSVLLLMGSIKAFEIDKDNKQGSEIQESCEHEWVITSEYSFWFNSYRTVSKCSKCGKVVK